MRTTEARNFAVILALVIFLAVHGEAGEAKGLPSSFDVRSVMAINPIKNQGQTGMVVAYASVDAMEISLAYQGQGLFDLSEDFLTTCDTTDFPDAGCGGGTIPIAFVQQTGFVLAADFPAGTPAARCSAARIFRKAAAAGYVGGAGTVPTQDQIKKAILKYGSVVAGIAADDKFGQYAGGVFSDCQSGVGSDAINHVITLIGWDDAGSFWLARNSWGGAWGEKGYARIKYGCDAVAQLAYYIAAPPK